ncbi:MSCRAMM family protein [Terriglobus saanensis]|uniref:Uncharacterized protein n=1 Tax=Terriglobus saanensis (strain ATCC BAA-1853 / DSM 23119 / SP1PR4) TaxID=401053 RepID=E8V377_TERSS|nr:carboxypeptidase regulatory-like domain-containing protein [Terriglobus saanensis]ADV82434.1 hypothetical protein AciPR4_1620 [Terriglobus saanensis SP1PR4]
MENQQLGDDSATYFINQKSSSSGPERSMAYRLIERSLLLALLFVCGMYRVWPQDKNCYCSISGSIVEQENVPLSADVLIYKLEIQDGRATPAPACTTKTDGEGRYVCNLRSRGQYIVQAHARQQPAREKVNLPAPTTIYPVTFYPNTTNVDTAIRLVITDGERGSANIMFAAVEPSTIHVALPTNPPRSSLTVSMHGHDYDLATEIIAAYNAAAGTFDIHSISPGIYRIDAGWYADAADHRATVTTTTQSNLVATINLQETTNARIEGKLQEGTWPQLKWPSALVLRSTGNGIQKELASSVSSDGRIVFPSVPAGEYRLAVQGAGDTFVQLVALNGKSLPDGRIPVAVGERYGLLDIQLSNLAASVEGKVDTGSETGAVSVVIQSEFDGEVRTLTTDQQKHFQIMGLSPGQYRLYAWSSLQNVEYRNADYLARFVRDSTEVNLDEAEHATQVELHLSQQVD